MGERPISGLKKKKKKPESAFWVYKISCTTSGK